LRAVQCSDLLFLLVSDLHVFYVVFFFFYRFGDHRDLHSFPTRRSSDLSSAIEASSCIRVGLSIRSKQKNASGRFIGSSSRHCRSASSRPEGATSTISTSIDDFLGAFLTTSESPRHSASGSVTAGLSRIAATAPNTAVSISSRARR